MQVNEDTIDTNDLTNDLTNLESNINKLDIITISVNNYNVEKIDISSIKIKNNILNKLDFINILKDLATNNNDYKLKYILKFLLKINVEILNDNIDNFDNIFELSVVKKIENLEFNNSFFNETNSLLLIIDKKQKLNIKNKKKKNSTKKNQKFKN